jgi:N-acetylmuramoyl-L-alanine amidase
VVYIDLLGQVQYEAHRLSNPERIYLDFPDTTLAPGLFGKIIETGDPRLVRVRAAQPSPGVSRVVLETRHVAEFTVRMESNPARLVIEVRETPAQTSTALNDAATPVPSATHVQPRSTANAPLRIVLDAGHGGWDLGTVGRKGLLEKDLVLDVVSRLGKLVQQRLNADVTYTRAGDHYLSLEKRAEIANLAQADLFVSVHANYSSDATARGVETYYSNTYSSARARTAEADDQPELQNLNWTNVDIRTKVFESRRFASAIQKSLYGTIAASTPGTRNRGVKQAAYAVLTGTTMPAVLAEISFVSSPEDEVRLEDAAYRQEIAEALFRGIQRYKASLRKTTIAAATGPPAGH